TLPEGVRPALGPDATALGQIFWYTLEGRDPQGRPTGGWDLQELRSVQDFTVRYALQGARGVSEVASVGGFVTEYQIDVDPDAMRHYGVTLGEVYAAVRSANIDVGARTVEIANAEYVVRGVGFLKSLADLELSVVKTRRNVPVRLKDIAHVGLGPAMRRGALDKEGAEAVGGVVVVRYGENPLATIKAVKEKISEIQPGLPRRTLTDGTVSQVTVVPFYDRTTLIRETLGTLETALIDEVLISVVVVIVMLLHLRSSLLISGLLPLAVLMCFIAMKHVGVDANVVALSGIAIAIGTMVDMGIVLCESIVSRLARRAPDESRMEAIYAAAVEVGGAVVTAVSTTVVSFLPVFTMEAAEGKLFKPLAYTKTFALLASVVVALTVIPPFAHLLFAERLSRIGLRRWLLLGVVSAASATAAALTGFWVLLLLPLPFCWRPLESLLPERWHRLCSLLINLAVLAYVTFALAGHWLPLGPERGELRNFAFVGGLVVGVLLSLRLFMVAYEPLLRAFLRFKIAFLALPLAAVVAGACAWLGFAQVFFWVPRALERLGIEAQAVKSTKAWVALHHMLPGLGKEFMPPLDEGSYLFMPTTMPHASIGEALDVLQKLDMAIAAIPEVDSVVGKIGRVESALDPAPISMVETVITYVPEYALDKRGRRLRFRYDEAQSAFARDSAGDLIPASGGRPYRQWRPEIASPDDIWQEIVRAAKLPGTTSAPKLQPIAARIVMLQSGMRAPMGIKVRGPSLEAIERFGLDLERALKHAPGVNQDTVVADRVVGKPYLEIRIDRQAAARYGITVRQLQHVVEVAIGGRPITFTVEGRERYPVRVRYLRERRGDLHALSRVLVPAPDGTQIPLAQLAQIEYVRGPQAIKSEDTFLTSYVVFDKLKGRSEVQVVEDCRSYLEELVDTGELSVPEGVSYAFAGSYENQIRAEKRLRLVLPLALLIIFLILYLNFREVPMTLFVFSAVAAAWAGGFIFLWLYGQPWFLDFEVSGVSMRTLFQVRPYNLSVAVWVGFLALFGIATDDGVIMGVYLKQSFARLNPRTRAEVREAVVQAGLRRIRPCLMTTATTVLALVPVLTSTGRGADVMVPMAIPSFGGMLFELVTLFIVPVLYCAREERRL
ncbi:efflux RND transporter permease subunit, partial [Planctomycetota bacterium]